MLYRKVSILSLLVLPILTVCFQTTSSAQGPVKEKSVFIFNGTDGNAPTDAVIFDPAGNAYGTTTLGGKYNLGTVFELSRATHGAKETVLHSFAGGSDGGHPHAGLVLDAAGNLYGTTLNGGAAAAGTVFELTPNGKDWTETVLYTFTNGVDGGSPYASLLLTPEGKLVGTTSAGGASGHGTVFMLTPAGGKWHEAVLYSFTGGSDGGDPRANVIADASGNLYGTTASGGNDACDVKGVGAGCGAVFELSHPNGNWLESVLYTFTGTNGDGINPVAALLFDSAGNLYGTTQFGGPGTCLVQGVGSGCGIVFELSPADGGWKETIIHSFDPANNEDGAEPIAPLIFDPAGDLLGTTRGGGQNTVRIGAVYGGDGTVFELSPSNGSWQESLLFLFNGHDGGRPCAGLTPYGNGIFIGTVLTAGQDSVDGVVFSVRP